MTDKPMAEWLARHIKKWAQKYPRPVTLQFPVARQGHGKSVADDLRPLLPSDWTVESGDVDGYNAFLRNQEIIQVVIP